MIEFRPKLLMDKPALLVLVGKDQIEQKTWLSQLPGELKSALASLTQGQVFKAEKGELFPVVQKNRTVLFVGLGARAPGFLTTLRVAVRQALASEFIKTVREVELAAFFAEDAEIIAVIEGVLIGTYTWDKYRTAKNNECPARVRQVYLVVKEKKCFAEAVMVCDGVTLARDLVNDNADVVHSEAFEEAVFSVSRGCKQASIKILNEEELKEKGLNLHLAVNKGSQYPPKLIIVKYRGASRDARTTALVGKGITFDTGGLNLKPSGHLETMRSDMSGAAALLGTLKNVIHLGLKKNIIFAFGLAENAIGPLACKPGDVFKSYSGKTVEVANTDAEGRLVLADAISYVVRNYKPQRLIDIATLTGACVIALGYDYSGLVSNNETLAGKLLSASDVTDDRLWRLPNYPELKDAVESQVADLRNLGFPKGAAGTMTAAEFLRQFTEDTPWAHIDIAGTAFREGKSRLYYAAGATGAGVRLLTEFLKRN